MQERERVSDAIRWRNWAGDEVCAPATICVPGDTEELRGALARACDRAIRVRVVGAGHSFSDAVCTDGMLIDLRRFDRVLDVDRSSGLVRVQGGITLKALSCQLAEHGLAMENLGDIDSQTIAGAISTATHGTGARLANISAQVAALTLVLADGSTLHCSAEREQEAFLAARVGLGALGVVTEVTIRCVPAFQLHRVDSRAPLAAVLERFDDLASGNDHFEFYVFPHTRTALTMTSNRTQRRPAPRRRSSAYLDDILLTNHLFGAFCRLGRRAPAAIPQLNRLVTALAGKRTRLERSHQIFCTQRLVKFTEMEYALPRGQTTQAVKRVLELVDRERFTVPFPIETRVVAADDAFLSTASGRDSGFVAVHMFEGMEWRPYFQGVAAIMDELGGRPHWGKRHFHTAETLRARYPDWDRFQAVRARLDPHGLFANAWSDRILGPPCGRDGSRRVAK